jgi:sulfur carrier protein
MSSAPEILAIQLNGSQRSIAGITSPVFLDKLLAALELKPDRIAVELNGTIAPRTSWAVTEVRTGDKLEVVHFVGGGASPTRSAIQPLPAVSCSSSACQRSP